MEMKPDKSCPSQCQAGRIRGCAKAYEVTPGPHEPTHMNRIADRGFVCLIWRPHVQDNPAISLHDFDFTCSDVADLERYTIMSELCPVFVIVSCAFHAWAVIITKKVIGLQLHLGSTRWERGRKRKNLAHPAIRDLRVPGLHLLLVLSSCLRGGSQNAPGWRRVDKEG